MVSRRTGPAWESAIRAGSRSDAIAGRSPGSPLIGGASCSAGCVPRPTRYWPPDAARLPWIASPYPEA
jgi:hypothetical protein